MYMKINWDYVKISFPVLISIILSYFTGLVAHTYVEKSHKLDYNLATGIASTNITDTFSVSEILKTMMEYLPITQQKWVKIHNKTIV